MQAEVDTAMPPALLRQIQVPLIALHGMAEMHAALTKHMHLIRTVDLQHLPTPSAKARRTSYEGYQPAGILKKNWRKLSSRSPVEANKLAEILLDDEHSKTQRHKQHPNPNSRNEDLGNVLNQRRIWREQYNIDEIQLH